MTRDISRGGLLVVLTGRGNAGVLPGIGEGVQVDVELRTNTRYGQKLLRCLGSVVRVFDEIRSAPRIAMSIDEMEFIDSRGTPTAVGRAQPLEQAFGKEMGAAARINRGKGRRGHAVVEVALLAPWILLLFAGILDFGFYAYAAISTANAARIAATFTSSSPSSLDDSAAACRIAIEEMRPLPNIRQAVNCPAVCANGAVCVAGPLTVTATARRPGVDGSNASEVRVAYTTVQMFPLPWLRGQFTITRAVQIRERT